jgi:hypothetical protein
MIEILAAVLIMAAIAGAAYYFKTRDRSEHYIELELDLAGISDSYAQFKKDYTTPLGARVQSTVDVPARFLQLIDEGLQNQITRHNRAFPGWDKYKLVSEYDILLIDPMGTNEVTEPGSPHIKVRGISTAGTCLGVYPRTKLKPYIVVPHQAGQDWRFEDYFMRSIWHESEHVREWLNDQSIFYYWAHSGDTHPHVGDE